MNIIKTILFFSTLLIPAVSIGHEYHYSNHSDSSGWHDNKRVTQYYYDDSYSNGRESQSRRSYKQKDNKNNKSKHYSKKKRVQSGWDVSPKIAKGAANCYRYKLSAQGGKGSARITSIQGKNYIQVNGTKKGYVCYQGDPTLELGKLGNPNVKVTFQLEGKGKYGFYRGQQGSKYKNHWYRSYWGL